MCVKLHGKVPENEPTHLAALPGVPNIGQRECDGDGTEGGRQVASFVMFTSAFRLHLLFVRSIKCGIEEYTM